MTPADLAERLQVKLRTAYYLLEVGGKLHHLRVNLGNQMIRVDPVRLEKFLADGGSLNADR